MFDDFVELDSGAALDLETALRKRYTLSKQPGNGGRAISKFVQRVLNVFRQEGGGQQQPPSDAEQGGHELQAPLSEPTPISDADPTGTNAETPKDEDLRLLLCVADGRAKTTLKQEVLQNINDDRELFIYVRKQYFTKRNWFALRSVGAVSLAQVCSPTWWKCANTDSLPVRSQLQQCHKCIPPRARMRYHN